MNEEKLLIGKYIPDASNSEAYHYVDKYNLFITYKPNRGLGDCIGRSMRAYLAYHDIKLIEGIEELWQFSPEHNNKMVGIRHPDITDEVGDDKVLKKYWIGRMSRDHYINTLVALKVSEGRNYYKNGKLQEIVKATPFKIRKMARWTLPLILWSKSLVDNNKKALWWYLILDLITVKLFYLPIYNVGTKLAKWKPEVDQEDWTTQYIQHQPKWKQKLNKIVMPAYALGHPAYQLYVTPNTYPKLKKKLQKSYLKMVGETNYVQKMLLGETNIPRDKIESYKPMHGGRWSGHLNERNDRNLKVIPEDRFKVNLLDVDLVKYLYNETQIKK